MRPKKKPAEAVELRTRRPRRARSGALSAAFSKAVYSGNGGDHGEGAYYAEKRRQQKPRHLSLPSMEGRDSNGVP
jgi:hypothetical protein